MPKYASKIEPSNALYIKLGDAGKWEAECVKKGIIRFGYKETPIDAAVSGDWEAVHKFWLAFRKDHGAATRDTKQISSYYEAGEDTLWITFHHSSLWWCFAKSGVKQCEDGNGSYRETVDGWKNADIKGNKLTFEKLSGRLLKTQGFRGTICNIKEFEYLKRKINGESLPEVEEAVEAENHMVQKIIPLIKGLTWQDFELLVDLVFSNSGWRRISSLGKTQKDIDMELILPTTNERAYVQIKSSTGKSDLAEHVTNLEDSDVYSRLFFVFHTGDIKETEEGKVTVIGPNKLARMVFDAGLTSWLIDKRS